MVKPSRPTSIEDAPIMDHFQYSHLNDELAEVSALFHDLAWAMHDKLKYSAEVTAGLRKLLEAKDCFIRQAAQEQRKRNSGGLTGGLNV